MPNENNAPKLGLTMTQDDEIEEQDDCCPTCDGTGEGMYDGTSCRSCGGSGSTRAKPDDDWYDYDED